MLKKTIFIILTLIFTLNLTACSKENETYTIEHNETENSQELVLEKILKNSETTIEVSKAYQGTSFNKLFLTKYSTNEQFELSEICNSNKPTLIFTTSALCASCDSIDYTKILTLEENMNVVIITLKDYIDSTKFTKKGIYNTVYIIDDENLINAYNDNDSDKNLGNDYSNVILGLGLPSCIFLNSDGTFAFGVNGVRTLSELKLYNTYLY